MIELPSDTKKKTKNKHTQKNPMASPSVFLSLHYFCVKFLLVPVCPHAGGVGLCELVQHLIIFDYISVSTSLQNRLVTWH